ASFGGTGAAEVVLARVGPTTPTRPPGLPLPLSRLDRLSCCFTLFAPERLSPSAREPVHPVYAQGMTAAALGVQVLDRWLREESSQRGPGRCRAFQRRLARATTAAWQRSTGADYRFRTTEGPSQGRIARLTGYYIAGVMRAAARRPWVRRRLEEVFHLLRPPSALFGPGGLARLARDRLPGPAGAAHRAA